MSAETRIEGKKWDDLCTSTLNVCLCLNAHVPLIVGVGVCMSELVQECKGKMYALVCLEEVAAAVGGGNKNH